MSEMNDRVKEGGCLCGDVRYQTWGEPIDKSTCHCPWCKKLSGAVYASQIVVPKENYKITQGNPKYFSMEHKGEKYGNWFCGKCGSTVGRDASSFPDIRVIKIGTLDKREDMEWAKPLREVYTSERVAWVPEYEYAMQIAEIPTEAGLSKDGNEAKL